MRSFGLAVRRENWNSTHNGQRDLFLVRVENQRYHVVRDWLRSIYPVTAAGPHSIACLSAIRTRSGNESP